jgi:nicotinamide-nucleotide amidase
MVAALRDLLLESDAVIVCGGLGPTQDDVTRDAIAELMGVALERREDLVEQIAAMFGTRGRDMPANNLRQADVPVGGDVIPNPIGTAPGLECEISGDDGRTRVIYAVPGVPYEMQQMVTDHVLPDLLERSGERAVIVSRSLKTWGTSESALAEMIAHRVDVQANPTIAFLARGIEGLYVRLTAKAPSDAEARELITAEEVELRAILGELIFAVDDETMESVVLAACEARGWTLGVAESLTGGLVGARITNVSGASRTFRGAVASYATDVKRSLLGVTAEHVVSAECAIQMAEGVRQVLGCDVAVSTTGVAGPEEQDDQPVGTVWFGIAISGHETEAVSTRLPGDRERIRQFSTISVLNLLRLRLASLA